MDIAFVCVTSAWLLMTLAWWLEGREIHKLEEEIEHMKKEAQNGAD